MRGEPLHGFKEMSSVCLFSGRSQWITEKDLERRAQWNSGNDRNYQVQEEFNPEKITSPVLTDDTEPVRRWLSHLMVSLRWMPRK